MNKLILQSNTRKTNNGFTLIEILISVVILSIGLLGMAGIQIKGMHGTQNSFYKTSATHLANNIAELMHANPLAADNPDSDLDNQYLITNSGSVSCGTVPTLCTGTAADCSSSEMASFDLYTWACGTSVSGDTFIGGINNLLPNGAGSITCIDNNVDDVDTCSPGSTHRITITWDDTTFNPDENATTAADLFTGRSIVLNTVP